MTSKLRVNSVETHDGKGKGVLLYDYEGGVVIEEPSSLVRDGNKVYILSENTPTPYTMKGTGMPENGAFERLGEGNSGDSGGDNGDSGGGGGDPVVGLEPAEEPITLNLTNGWQVKNDYVTPAYYKDGNGIVHLQGAADGSNSTDKTVGVLPVGYRPKKMVGTITAMEGSPIPLLVTDEGRVHLYTDDLSSVGTGFLDGFYFRT